MRGHAPLIYEGGHASFIYEGGMPPSYMKEACRLIYEGGMHVDVFSFVLRCKELCYCTCLRQDSVFYFQKCVYQFRFAKFTLLIAGRASLQLSCLLHPSPISDGRGSWSSM